MGTRNVFSQLREGLQYVPHHPDSKIRLEVLNSIRDFVYSGWYTDYRKKELLLSNELESQETLSQILGISKDGVRQVKKRISDDALKAIGKDTIHDVVYEGLDRVKVAKSNMEVLISLTKEKNGLVLPNVIELIQRSVLFDEVKTFDYKECRNELLFLNQYSTNRLRWGLPNLDLDKLVFLMAVVDGKVEGHQERINVVKTISDLSKLRFVSN